MAGLRHDALIIKTQNLPLPGDLYVPNYAQIYSMSGGIYALNEFNETICLSITASPSPDLSQYSTLPAVASLTGSLQTQITSINVIDTAQQATLAQIASVTGSFATTTTVAAVSAGLNIRLNDVQIVNSLQSTQIQALSASVGSGVIALSGLHDVTITAPISGQTLQYNGTKWVNLSGGIGGSTTLSGLSDVTITAPISGQVLSYNGTTWVNSANNVLLNGQIPCSTGISVYQINHSGIDINTSYPIVSLETPAISSTLFVQSITERTSAGFKVVLSGMPSNDNYKINWIIGTSSSTPTTISNEQIPLIFSVSSYPYYVDLNYVPTKYIANNIVGTIKSWEIISENGTPGNVDVSVWYNAASLPTSANSIVGSNHPKLVNENQHKDTSLAGWTTSVNNGYFGFQVQSISGIQGFTLQLLLQKV